MAWGSVRQHSTSGATWENLSPQRKHIHNNANILGFLPSFGIRKSKEARLPRQGSSLKHSRGSQEPSFQVLQRTRQPTTRPITTAAPLPPTSTNKLSHSVHSNRPLAPIGSIYN